MKFLFYLLMIFAAITSCQKKSDVKTATETAATDTLKQKDGRILTFGKTGRKLVSLKRDQMLYSENYQKRLAKIAEYYIAETNSSLVKFHASKPESVLGYSYEENDWEGVSYTQIGIFSKSGSNMSTLQWLFYEPKSQRLYEFDLNTRKLQEFK